MFTKSFIVLGIFSLLLSFNTFAARDQVLYVICGEQLVPCENDIGVDGGGISYCPKTRKEKIAFCASKGTK